MDIGPSIGMVIISYRSIYLEEESDT